MARKGEKQENGCQGQQVGDVGLQIRHGVGYLGCQEEIPQQSNDDISSGIPLHEEPALRDRPSHVHMLPPLPPALDLVLGAQGPEESEPGPGGPAPCGH